MVPDERQETQTLAERAVAAWREEDAAQEELRRTEAVCRLERRQERFVGLVHRLFGRAIPLTQVDGDLSGPLTAPIDDVVFADGTEYEFGEGVLYVARRCGICGEQAYNHVESLWTLGKTLAHPAECSACFSRAAKATEALVEAGRSSPPAPSPADQALGDWGLAFADLEQALADATDAARLLRTLQRTARVAFAEHARAVRTALAGQPASEPERVGAFLERALGDDQYRAILTDIESQTRRWEQAAMAAELARQRCRLAQAVVTLHAAGRRENGDG